MRGVVMVKVGYGMGVREIDYDPETQEDKDEDIRREISSALGGDFFADLDSAFLFPLFADWQSASKDEEKQKRSAFFAEFNLALDRAIKRKQIKE